MALLHRHRKSSKFITRQPNGLPELMADISREVLNNQPHEMRICSFVADYLETLLEMRNRFLALENVLKSISQSENYLYQKGIRCQTAFKINLAIQNAFRKYIHDLETCSTDNDLPEFNEFEFFKELMSSCDLKCDELLRVKPILKSVFKDFAVKYCEYRKKFCKLESNKEIFTKHYMTCNNLEKLNQAAIKIQAYFRGYYVRKNLKNCKNESSVVDDMLKESSNIMLDDLTESTEMRSFEKYMQIPTEENMLQSICSKLLAGAARNIEQVDFDSKEINTLLKNLITETESNKDYFDESRKEGLTNVQQIKSIEVINVQPAVIDATKEARIYEIIENPTEDNNPSDNVNIADSNKQTKTQLDTVVEKEINASET